MAATFPRGVRDSLHIAEGSAVSSRVQSGSSFQDLSSVFPDLLYYLLSLSLKSFTPIKRHSLTYSITFINIHFFE